MAGRWWSGIRINHPEIKVIFGGPAIRRISLRSGIVEEGMVFVTKTAGDESAE